MSDDEEFLECLKDVFMQTILKDRMWEGVLFEDENVVLRRDNGVVTITGKPFKETFIQ